MLNLAHPLTLFILLSMFKGKVSGGLGGKVIGVNEHIAAWKIMSMQGYGIELGG